MSWLWVLFLLGTANTMACVSEALGMSLPGSALYPRRLG